MTTTSPILETYQNGNCFVTIHADGTKVRTYEDEPQPVFPESIDLCITKHCRLNCPWCHESAAQDGKHADLMRALLWLDNYVPHGIEVAIGGGDPLRHPDLPWFLRQLQTAGFISNMTVRLWDSEDSAFLSMLRPMIWGLGLSSPFGSSLLDANTVLHLIAGVDSVWDARLVARKHKVLVLGYKRHGRGADYYDESVEQKLAEWRHWIPTLLREAKLLSFDNLALKQLEIQKHVSPDVWQERYMGDDGQFTMYVDAVNWEYAASSTSERHPIGNLTLVEAFHKVRGGK